MILFVLRPVKTICFFRLGNFKMRKGICKRTEVMVFLNGDEV